jgi:hypothetical protein
MTDMRAPDPTIMAMGEDLPVTVGNLLAVAHRPELRPTHPCSELRWSLPWMPASVAAYIAVPCRECFPSSPMPGACSCGNEPRGHTDPYLAWQIEGEE